MSNSADKQHPAGGPPAKAARAVNSLWPAVGTLPTDGNVFLIFHGLFLFAHRPSASGNVCEVGVHNDAPDHEFHIGAWRVDAAGVTTPLRVGSITGDPIELDVSPPRTPGALFFQPYDVGDEVEDEVLGELDRRDWRLVPDLEGTDFYNRDVEKIPGTLRPVITITHGIFYTELPTEREFVRISAGNVGDVVDLRRVAFYAAADVSHGKDGRVTLKANGQNLLPPLTATGGDRYVIYFSNSCPPDRRECIFIPGSQIKEERNDFHLYYRAFRVPARAHEFLMVMKNGRRRKAPKSPPPIQTFFDLKSLDKVGPRSTHEAPCGVTGYGRTTSGLGS